MRVRMFKVPAIDERLIVKDNIIFAELSAKGNNGLVKCIACRVGRQSYGESSRYARWKRFVGVEPVSARPGDTGESLRYAAIPFGEQGWCLLFTHLQNGTVQGGRGSRDVELEALIKRRKVPRLDILACKWCTQPEFRSASLLHVGRALAVPTSHQA